MAQTALVVIVCRRRLVVPSLNMKKDDIGLWVAVALGQVVDTIQVSVVVW